ncbi:MAG TPA: phytanoyl-CoA dioxygenase family protein [Vicinamibacteria bacterium]|nr:phytanoyl-CoA dioxygenase family protein [Vicinamibacteria bacterium]
MESGDPRLVDATELPPARVGDRARGGELLVVRGCLQRLGLLDGLRGDAVAAIAEVAGEERAKRIAAAGLERLHRDLNGRETVAVAEALTARVRVRSAPFAARLLEGVLGRRVLLFFEEGPRGRIHVPFARRPRDADGVAALVERIGPGAVTPHGPHRDGWFGLPRNSIDVWIALGRVRPGNGLSLFPDALGRPIGRDAMGRIAPAQGFGRPANVALEPGDALVFRGDHVHASELNRTEEARVVVSYRATIGLPLYSEAPAFRFRYAGAASGPLAAALSLGADLQWHGLRRLMPALRRILPRRAAAGDSALRLPEPLAAGALAAAGLPESGAIRPIDGSRCAVRLPDGRTFAFERSCPHEGGDLAAATLRDGQIVCPGHGAPFDVLTGRSGCPGVGDIEVRALE